jgi:hypothetical protein
MKKILIIDFNYIQFNEKEKKYEDIILIENRKDEYYINNIVSAMYRGISY